MPENQIWRQILASSQDCPAKPCVLLTLCANVSLIWLWVTLWIKVAKPFYQSCGPSDEASCHGRDADAIIFGLVLGGELSICFLLLCPLMTDGIMPGSARLGQCQPVEGLGGRCSILHANTLMQWIPLCLMTSTCQNCHCLLRVLVTLCVSNTENVAGKKSPDNHNQSQTNWKLRKNHYE